MAVQIYAFKNDEANIELKWFYGGDVNDVSINRKKINPTVVFRLNKQLKATKINGIEFLNFIKNKSQ